MTAALGSCRNHIPASTDHQIAPVPSRSEIALSGSQGQGFARQGRIPTHVVGAVAQDEIDRTDSFAGCKGASQNESHGKIVIVRSRAAIRADITAGLTFTTRALGIPDSQGF